MQVFRDPRARNSSAEQPIVIPTNRARQGVTGHNVRYVLGFSLAGAIIALALIYLLFFMVR